MIDTKNKEIRKVMTPIGRGSLTNSFNPDNLKHEVIIKREDCLIPTQSKFRIVLFSADELEEIE